MGHRSRLAGAAASEDGELEAVKSAGVEWVLREALLALVRASATFEAGKLRRTTRRTPPTRSRLKDLHPQVLTIVPAIWRFRPTHILSATIGVSDSVIV